jgi:hypothetical protein
MPEHAFAELLGALTTEHAAFVDSDLADYLSQTLKETPEGDIEGLVDTAMWVYAGEAVLSTTLSNLIADISKSQDLPLSDEERSLLSTRLSTLLQTGALSTTWKALDVLTENDKNYWEARIVTDIRTIFGNDVNEPPVAAVIQHTLKIHFHHGARHDEVFIALDEYDLDQLQETLDRAKTKAKSLRTVIDASGLTYLSPHRSS